MIEGIIIAIALFVLIAVIFIKFYNVAKGGHEFQGLIIYGGLALGLICWFLVFTSFAAALQFEETVTNGSDTYTITGSDAVQLSFYLPVANVLVLLNLFLTFVESVVLFSKSVIQPKMPRRG